MVILGLLLYPMIMMTEKQDIIFIVLFKIFVLLPIAFLALKFRIKRSYRKNPLWQNMEVTLIFDKEAFITRNIRGEFRYTYERVLAFLLKKRTALPRPLTSC